MKEPDRFIKAFGRTKSSQDPKTYLQHVMKGGNFEAKWKRAIVKFAKKLLEMKMPQATKRCNW